MIAELNALLLLGAANGAPLFGRTVCGKTLGYPLDAGLRFFDGRRILGPSKTIRGVVLSLLATPVAAAALGLPWKLGLFVAAFAMLGDSTSSFVKRRLNFPPSSMALGIDQIPESLFPLLACRGALGLDIVDIVVLVAAFTVLELILSRVLYRLHLRERPY